MSRPKLDMSDPRVKLATIVSNVGFLLLIASLAWRIKGGRSGPGAEWRALFAVAVVLIIVLCEARLAVLCRSASKATNVPLYLFIAFAAATGRSDEFDPPAWLTGIAVAVLAITIGVAIPFAAYVVSRTQDERERKIVLTAMSVAFMVTMVVMGTFVQLDEFTSVRAPSMSWVLLAGIASWFGSFSVLRKRM